MNEPAFINFEDFSSKNEEKTDSLHLEQNAQYDTIEPVTNTNQQDDIIVLDNDLPSTKSLFLLGPSESEEPRFLAKLNRKNEDDIYEIDDTSNTSDDQYQPVRLSINSNGDKQSKKKFHDINNNSNNRPEKTLGYYVDKKGFYQETNRKRRMSNQNEKHKKVKSPIHHSSATSNSDRLSTDDDNQNDEFSSYQNAYNELNGFDHSFAPIQEYSKLLNPF
jgi:hypothetical protein